LLYTTLLPVSLIWTSKSSDNSQPPLSLEGFRIMQTWPHSVTLFSTSWYHSSNQFDTISWWTELSRRRI
jgi:hypothetical protein